MWLAYQDRLKTTQKLMHIRLTEDDLCAICGTQIETRDHLFFNCDFSRQCIDKLRQWLKVTWNIKNLKDLYRKRRMPRGKVKIIEAILSNLVYAIWRVRNEAVWNKRVTTVQ